MEKAGPSLKNYSGYFNNSILEYDAQSKIRSCHFSPSDKGQHFFASTNSNQIMLWDRKTASPEKTYNLQKKNNNNFFAFSGIAGSPLFLTVGTFGVYLGNTNSDFFQLYARKVTAEEAEEDANISEGKIYPINCARFLQGEKFIVGSTSAGHKMMVWEVQSNTEKIIQTCGSIWSTRDRDDEDDEIQTFEFLKDSNNLISTGSGAGVIKIWDLEAKRSILTIEKGKDKEGTSCLLPLDINTLIAGSCLGSIEVYDVRSGKLEKCIGSLGERHGFVRIGKNGHLAAYVSDNEIVLTDIKNDKIIEKIPTDDYAKDLHISDDCKEILIGFGCGKVSILISEKEK